MDFSAAKRSAIQLPRPPHPINAISRAELASAEKTVFGFRMVSVVAAAVVARDSSDAPSQLLDGAGAPILGIALAKAKGHQQLRAVSLPGVDMGQDDLEQLAGA